MMMDDENIYNNMGELVEYKFDADYQGNDNDDDKIPGCKLQLYNDNDDDSDGHNELSTHKRTTTSRSGRSSRAYRENNLTYTQVDSDLVPWKIQVVHYEIEVQNYFDQLIEIENSASYQEHLRELMFTQLSIKQGINKHPVEGKDAGIYSVFLSLTAGVVV